MKTHAIRIHEFGSPEVLSWEEVDLAELAAGEARIRHTAVGLNLIDTYHRTGLYPMDLPTGLGSEAAGVVEAVAADVTDIAVGDRVVYTGRPADAYSERRNFDASRLVRIPDTMSDDVAAAVFLKGLTAWYLLRRSYRVADGDTILLYAAAG
ncbi:MAG: alcohol dehydrogenase catalytic domain-containing protein, partial [Gammaproteobacteria bacterium]|nr:alcohol dehydrogenase catalytic domain-containing protein [Gammaproteobacteria bacterium]